VVSGRNYRLDLCVFYWCAFLLGANDETVRQSGRERDLADLQARIELTEFSRMGFCFANARPKSRNFFSPHRIAR
jgi:hypothetical protein